MKANKYNEELRQLIEEKDDFDTTQESSSTFVYRPTLSSELDLKAEADMIKRYFGVSWSEMLVISFSEESKLFRDKLEPSSEYCERNYVVSGNNWKENTEIAYKVPGTEILIMSRQYGFITRKSDWEALNKFILSISLSPACHDELALDKVFWDSKTESLKNDVKFFSRSKSWFDKRDMPYSRSYLLYGTPGNGKTSAIRAISKFFNTEPQTFSFTARWDDPDASFLHWITGGNNADSPEEYRTVFNGSQEKENTRIRILLLEDIDRFFSKEEGVKTPVSFSAILNALDGVDQRKNSILIATANNPEKIDSQVLFRPGRFDLRVPFNAPGQDGMIGFLTKLSEDDSISPETIAKIAELAKGHSFAFVKGVYMAAANKAFSRASEIINDEDILSSLNEFLANMGKDIKSSNNRAGF